MMVRFGLLEKAMENVLEEFMVEELEEGLEEMKRSYEERKTVSDSLMFFHSSRNKDLREIQRHIDAFKTVISYYKVPETKEKDE